MIDPYDIPPKEILEAAEKVHLYFAKKGVRSWELMNICSRDNAERLRSAEAVIRRFNESINVLKNWKR